MTEDVESVSTRRMRRHILLRGGFIALIMLVIGLANEVSESTWTGALGVGVATAAIALALNRADRATWEEKNQVRRTHTVAMVSSVLVGGSVYAIAYQFTDLLIAVTLAAVTVMAVWTVIAWRVGRPGSRLERTA